MSKDFEQSQVRTTVEH